MAEQKPVDLAAVSFRVSGLAGACGLGRCEHSCGVRRLLVDSGDLFAWRQAWIHGRMDPVAVLTKSVRNESRITSNYTSLPANYKVNVLK